MDNNFNQSSPNSQQGYQGQPYQNQQGYQGQPYQNQQGYQGQSPQNQQGYQGQFYQAPQGYQNQPQWGPPPAYQQKPKKSKAPLIIGLAVLITALIAAIVVLCIMLFKDKDSGGGSSQENASSKKYNSPEALMETFVDAWEDMDADAMDKCIYPVVEEMYGSDVYDEFLNDMRDVKEEDPGVKVSISVDIRDKEEVSREEIEDMNNRLSEYSSYKEIKKAYSIEGVFNIKISSEEANGTENPDFVAAIVYAGGRYYIAYIEY